MNLRVQTLHFFRIALLQDLILFDKLDAAKQSRVVGQDVLVPVLHRMVEALNHRPHPSGKHRRVVDRLGPLDDLSLHQGDELIDTLLLLGGDFHKREAKLFRQQLVVDAYPLALHDVHHVKDTDHWDAHFHKLGGQVQIALDV